MIDEKGARPDRHGRTERANSHDAHPVPVVRAAQPGRVHLRRRRDAAPPRGRRPAAELGRLRVSARQSLRARTTSCGFTAQAAAAGSSCAATRARTTSSRAHRLDEPLDGTRRDGARFVARRQRWRLPAGGAIDRAQPLRIRLRRQRATTATRATRSLPRCSPTACTWSGAASSTTGRAASTAQASRSRTRWCSSRAARAPSRTCARRWWSSMTACVATSQNCWPSVRFDVGAINNAMSAIHPRGLLLQDVHVAADAALVAALRAPDPSRCRHGSRTAGARPGSLRAPACALRRAGDRRRPGRTRRSARGSCRRVRASSCATKIAAFRRRACSAPTRRSTIGRRSRGSTACWRTLAANRDVTLLPRTTAFGYYDGNLVGAVERVDGSSAARCRRISPRQRLWMIRAKSVVLASGAHRAWHRLREQRSARHDARGRGAHLCQALRGAVRDARRRVHQQRSARTRPRSRCTRRALTSPRSSMPGRQSPARRRAAVAGARGRHRARCTASGIARAHGRLRVSRVDVVPLAGGRRDVARLRPRRGVGWLQSAVHLYSQARGTPALRPDARRASCPMRRRCRSSPPAQRKDALRSWRRRCGTAHAAGLRCRRARRARCPSRRASPLRRTVERAAVEPLWAVPARGKGGKAFVDLQNDVTVRDIELAAREGYQAGRAPETLHDARHGHRPGQDQQRHRARADGGAARACRSPRSARRRFARRTRR